MNPNHNLLEFNKIYNGEHRWLKNILLCLMVKLYS